MTDDIIIAQCTPQGSGAIAMIRLSGNNVRELVNTIACLSSKKSITTVDTHTVHHGYVVETDGTAIDEVMFVVMDAPRTFTGESVIEISCHNNQIIIERIITLAISIGARLAQRGEFAQRAFLHNKLDLMQAEAINELIHAQTEAAVRSALAQVRGSFSQMMRDLEQRLVRCLALCEASFEFLDEEISFGEPIAKEIAHISETIAHLKRSFDQQNQIKEGVRVALIGSVNAGKSSLFNTLLGKERAIVTDMAGTTRDVLEASIRLGSLSGTLIDTAGLRQTDDIIEQEGIRRSFEEAQKADIILLVIDSSRAMTEQEFEVYDRIFDQHVSRIILVYTKKDIESYQHTFKSHHSSQQMISKHDASSIDHLYHLISRSAQDRFSQGSVGCILNMRHYTQLEVLERLLLHIQTMLVGVIAYELLSIHLNDALQVLSELTGKSISERAMDAVFREFCVGK